MQKSGPVPTVVAAILIVAVLCTLIVHAGWLVWIPVLAALAVVAAVCGRLKW